MASRIEIILQFLQSGVETAIKTADIMLSPYHESYREARRSMLAGGSLPTDIKRGGEISSHGQQSLYSLINRMKRDGLVRKSRVDGRSFWSITERGIRRLKTLLAKSEEQDRESGFIIDNKKRVIICAFDIPETRRRDRGWLRGLLGRLNFTMAQKSLWIGHGAVNDSFVRELHERRLSQYVDIFEVGSRGTLRRLDK